ncbi:MAG: hypothetical protein ACI9S8_002833 [Chlamydiales bacterium]|jgi:hypothetical protein
MLAWKNDTGDIFSKTFENAQWNNIEFTNHNTDGQLTLSSLGSNIPLIFKTVGQETMSVVSYNTESFNVVSYADSAYSGPYDDTTMGQWSPSAFPVAHFLHGPNPLTPDENEPLLQAYLSGDSFVAASLDGVMHLVHPDPEKAQLMTETFSIRGVMTPKLKVSYNSSDETSTSNGYGTLAEAGWSTQPPLNTAYTRGNLEMAKFGSSIVLAYQADSSGTIQICRGQYVKKEEHSPRLQLAGA